MKISNKAQKRDGGRKITLKHLREAALISMARPMEQYERVIKLTQPWVDWCDWEMAATELGMSLEDFIIEVVGKRSCDILNDASSFQSLKDRGIDPGRYGFTPGGQRIPRDLSRFMQRNDKKKKQASLKERTTSKPSPKTVSMN